MTTVPLPPPELRLHQDSDDAFLANCLRLAEMVYAAGMPLDGTLLDVGCGVGRLPIGLLSTGFTGRYFGFDVSLMYVRWAKQNLGPLGDLGFKHTPVYNDRYNTRASTTADAFTFPVGSDEYDVAALFSLFTHFYRRDIESYLTELARVLKPGGRVVVTFFLWNEERLPAIMAGPHPLRHQLDADVRYWDEDDPLWAIGYSFKSLDAMAGGAGFHVSEVQLGTWAGGPGPQLQDVVVLTKG
jgi:SAM-dependent methyltransferase